MKIEDILKNSKHFLSLTTLHLEEFDLLLICFEVEWEKYYRYRTLEGKPRKHPHSQEHGNAILQGTTQKLFFLLIHLKINSLQEHQDSKDFITDIKSNPLEYGLNSPSRRRIA